MESRRQGRREAATRGRVTVATPLATLAQGSQATAGLLHAAPVTPAVVTQVQ